MPENGLNAIRVSDGTPIDTPSLVKEDLMNSRRFGMLLSLVAVILGSQQSTQGQESRLPPGDKVFDRRVMTPTQREDQGTIYVFDTRPQAGATAVRILRGHRGGVVALAFAQLPSDRSPVLVSAAEEWDDQKGSVGAVRLWNLKQEKSLGR